MAVRYDILPLRWRSLGFSHSQAVERCLHRTLLSWEGTPYYEGGSVQKVGVDCVHFICGVLDGMIGRSPTKIPKMPYSIARHDISRAQRHTVQLLRLYRPWRKLAEAELIEPGDIIICGSPTGAPGHTMIVGCRQGILWHAVPGEGVRRSGYGVPRGGLTEKLAIVRYLDKISWRQDHGVR